MHELKTEINEDKFAALYVPKKFLSVIRFTNGLYTPYKRLKLSRLARFPET